jgi:hypothetical protein
MERNPREEKAVADVAELTFHNFDGTKAKALGSVENLPPIDEEYLDANLEAQQYKIPTSANTSNTSRFDHRNSDVTTQDTSLAGSYKRGTHPVLGATYDKPANKPAPQIATAPVFPQNAQSYSPTKGGETQVSFDSTGKMKVTRPGMLDKLKKLFS